MSLKKDDQISKKMATLITLMDQMNDLRSKINDIEKTMLNSTALLYEGLEKVVGKSHTQTNMTEQKSWHSHPDSDSELI